MTKGIRHSDMMEDDLHESIARIGDAVQPLSEEEKITMLQSIRTSLASESVRIQRSNRLGWTFLSFPKRIMPIIALFVALFVSIGGSAYAESALPGDLLYPVKIRVNENVRAMTSLSAEAKADWSVRRIERRLEEAELLAAKEKLSTDVSKYIASSVETNVADTHVKIENLRGKGKVSAAVILSSKLDSSLRTHETVLVRIARDRASVHAATNVLIESVRKASVAGLQLTQESEVEASNESTTTNNGLRIAAKESLKAAERKIEETRRFIETKRASASAESVTEAEVQLGVATSGTVSAQEQLNAGAHIEAFHTARSALRSAQEAKLLLQFSNASREGSHTSSSPSSSSRFSSSSSSSMSSSASLSSTSSKDQTNADEQMKKQEEKHVDEKDEENLGVETTIKTQIKTVPTDVGTIIVE